MDDPDTLDIPAAPPFPNSRLPVLLYRTAVPADPGGIEHAFAACGWSNAWRNGIYNFHHFHSIAHEVLGIAAGRVVVRLGGPAGKEVELTAGDVVVIPAGVAHCNLHEDGPLLVVGAYPGGAQFDTLRGNPDAFRAAGSRAAAVPVPDRDPVPGHDALRRLWIAAGAGPRVGPFAAIGGGHASTSTSAATPSPLQTGPSALGQSAGAIERCGQSSSGPLGSPPPE